MSMTFIVEVFEFLNDWKKERREMKQALSDLTAVVQANTDAVNKLVAAGGPVIPPAEDVITADEVHPLIQQIQVNTSAVEGLAPKA